MADKANDRLVWVDCEMTGLDIRKDRLIEIAALVTDSELNVLGEGVDVVIGAPGETLDGMERVVAEMHAASGLTDLVRSSAVTIAEAEQRVLAYVRSHVPDARSVPLCGNSIATDRSFIARDMPELDRFLHYRMIDVSSIKELSRRWFPRVYFAQPQKGLAHRALSDIRESIRELRYYRRTLFVAPPGPSSEEAQAAAREVLGVGAPERPVGAASERRTTTRIEHPPAEAPAVTAPGQPAAAPTEPPHTPAFGRPTAAPAEPPAVTAPGQPAAAPAEPPRTTDPPRPPAATPTGQPASPPDATPA